MRATIGLLAGLVPAAAFGAAPDAAPAAFLQALYAHYAPGRPDFSPLDMPASWFSPSLVALIKADEAAAGGEVGRLEGDPVCDCQDFGGFKVLSIKVTSQTAAAARAVVRFVNLGDTETLDISLVKPGGGWRIDDIGGDEKPALRALLTGPA
jgi:hypothetical protein